MLNSFELLKLEEILEEVPESDKTNFYIFDGWDFDREEPYNHLISRNQRAYDKCFYLMRKASEGDGITHARIIDLKTNKVTYYDAKLNIITLEEWQVLQNRHKIHFILGNSK